MTDHHLADYSSTVAFTLDGTSKVYMASFLELDATEDVDGGISISFGDVRSGLESLMLVCSAALRAWLSADESL